MLEGVSRWHGFGLSPFVRKFILNQQRDDLMRHTSVFATVFAFGLAAFAFPVISPAHAQPTSDLHGGTPAWGSGTFSYAPYRSLAYAPRRSYRFARSSRGGSTASRGCLTGDTQRVLSGLEARFGAVKVISTCRPGAVIAGNGHPSQHRFGRAVDFVPGPGQRGAMLAWLRANANGAVITYASGHVHFDTGGYRNYASPRARRAYAHWR